MLPRQTYLGHLEILEVYDYYDKPVLFACVNNTDQRFLVVQAVEEEEGDLWLYVAVSEARFAAIRAGEVDLYHAFKEAESGFVQQVRTFHTAQPAEIISLQAAELTDEQLPAQGEVAQVVSLSYG